MFKVGDKVVSNVNFVVNKYRLEYLKIYTISKIDKCMYFDLYMLYLTEQQFGFYADKFISIKEYRKLKINKLIENEIE